MIRAILCWFGFHKTYFSPYRHPALQLHVWYAKCTKCDLKKETGLTTQYWGNESMSHASEIKSLVDIGRPLDMYLKNFRERGLINAWVKDARSGQENGWHFTDGSKLFLKDGKLTLEFIK